MKILIKPFASVKDMFGFYEKEIIVSENITVGEVIKRLAESYAGLNRIKKNLLYAVNEEYCAVDTILKENDVLAIFPPVSGG
jgi:molybdopterin converting factor small subunit